jgi:hypothetical protein
MANAFGKRLDLSNDIGEPEYVTVYTFGNKVEIFARDFEGAATQIQLNVDETLRLTRTLLKAAHTLTKGRQTT